MLGPRRSKDQKGEGSLGCHRGLPYPDEQKSDGVLNLGRQNTLEMGQETAHPAVSYSCHTLQT